MKNCKYSAPFLDKVLCLLANHHSDWNMSCNKNTKCPFKLIQVLTESLEKIDSLCASQTAKDEFSIAQVVGMIRWEVKQSLDAGAS